MRMSDSYPSFEPAPTPTPPPAPPPPERGYRLPIAVGVLVGLVAGWVFVSGGLSGLFSRPSVEPRPIAPRGDLAADETTTIELFEQSSPAVVYITSLTHQRNLFSADIFEIPAGTGSGFVWDDQGHIVTNFHVIMNANAVDVTLADHSTHKATVVGVDPSKDLAVLKINVPPGKLQPLPIGTSKDLRVGQKVFAIGNPFGLDHTLTTGIVSALGRTITSFNNRKIEGVIQTDAAINPGNSGGPLLDSAGRLIGVNTQIASPSGASVGIGFAVPVDIVNSVVPEIIAHGRVVRPYLGIQVVDDSIVRRLRQDQLLSEDGVLVGGVVEGTGAAQAVLRGTVVDREGNLVLGDLIVSIDDQSVTSFDDLMKAMEKHKVGDVVTVRYIRDGRGKAAEIRLQAPP
jgi:S1-C subfamily serine protease